jgi:hypothetical protein
MVKLRMLQIALLSHQSCSQNRRIGCLHWRYKEIAIEIAVTIASVNEPLGVISFR